MGDLPLKFRYLYFFCLLIALALANPLSAQDPKAVEHYRTGYNLLKAQNYRNAAIELEEAIAIDTTYGNAFYALGKAYRMLNKYSKAIAVLEAAYRLEIARDRIPAELSKLYYKAAIKLFQQRKYTKAILNFEKSLEHAPNNAKAHYVMGLCYTGLRNPKAAQESYERAIEVDPGYAKPYKSLGDARRRERNYAPATKVYEQAILLDSTFMEAYSGLALVHMETKEYETAVTLLKKALFINPEYANGYLFLGTSLNRLSRWHEAVEPLREGADLNSKNAEIHYRLAEAYYGKGDYRQAIEAGNNATRRKRDYHPAQMLLGDAYGKLGQIDETRLWYGKAMKDNRLKDYCADKIEALERRRGK